MRFKILVAVLAAAGCARAPAVLQSSFDPAEVAWFAGRGTNTITGTAILRTEQGGVKTCAAQEVTLTPVSTYARERMRHLYGSDEEGFNPKAGGVPALFAASDQRYEKTVKSTRCDGRGHFGFTELPDGDYFVIAAVTWRARSYGLEDGGFLMRRVHVSTGEMKEVLLAHE